MRAVALLRLALLAAPLITPVGLVTGQTSPASRDSDTAKPRGWLIGGSIGVPTADGETSPDLFTRRSRCSRSPCTGRSCALGDWAPTLQSGQCRAQLPRESWSASHELV